MREKRNKRIEKKICNYSRKDIDPLVVANTYHKGWSVALTSTSILGPLLVSLLLAKEPFKTIDESESHFVFLHWISHNSISIIIIVVIVIAIIVTICRESFYRDVVEQIKSLTDQQQNENCMLLAFWSFANNSLLNIAKAPVDTKRTIQQYSSIMITCLYNVLLSLLANNYVTINIYDLRDGMVQMIDTFTPQEYVTSKKFVDSPKLFKQRLSITDPSIKDYFCVQCLRDDSVGRDGKFTLENWIEILKHFKCSLWSDEEKRNIIETKNRSKCLNDGFFYNQYIGIKFKPTESTTAFLEIIPKKKNKFTCEVKDLDTIATLLKEYFIPYLAIIWDFCSSEVNG